MLLNECEIDYFISAIFDYQDFFSQKYSELKFITIGLKILEFLQSLFCMEKYKRNTNFH